MAEHTSLVTIPETYPPRARSHLTIKHYKCPEWVPLPSRVVDRFAETGLVVVMLVKYYRNVIVFLCRKTLPTITITIFAAVRSLNNNTR